MKYLFLCGPGRSGTSALTELLNIHPMIALGMERYKYLYGKMDHGEDVGPPLFEKERFFDIRPTETNIYLSTYKNLDVLKRKYDSVEYRGDKNPGLLRFLPQMNGRFEDPRFIIIFRDIERVCSSWNARAFDENDHWPLKNDYKAAVRNYNEFMLKALEQLASLPDSTIIICYERLFGPEGEYCLQSLVQWLKLDSDQKLMDYLAANVETFIAIQEKPLIEATGQWDFIQKNLNWELVDKVKANYF